MKNNIEYIPLNDYFEMADYLGLEPKMTDWIRDSGQYEKVFNSYKCENEGCGSRIRKGVIIRDHKNGTDKVIGWDCMDSIDGGKLRASEKTRQSRRSLKVIYSFMSDYKGPDYFKNLYESQKTDPPKKDEYYMFLAASTFGFGSYARFILDLTIKYMGGGFLSEKQCIALEKAMKNREENLEKQAEENKGLKPIISGRRFIEGVIFSISKRESGYGLNIKAVIKTKDKLKFICNLPYDSLAEFDLDNPYKEGWTEKAKKTLIEASVSMNITLEETENKYFGRGKRPTKINIKLGDA